MKSPRDRSGVYLDTLPLFTSARARLLDNPRLISQFASLERRTFSTGRERIDLANSAAISMSLAAQAPAPMNFNMPFVDSRPRGSGALDPGLPAVVMDPGSCVQPGIAHGPEYSGGAGSHANFAIWWK